MKKNTAFKDFLEWGVKYQLSRDKFKTQLLNKGKEKIMPTIGEKVRSMYGCCGQVVAIVHPEESVIIQMDDGRTNRCHLWNFARLYKILKEENP